MQPRWPGKPPKNLKGFALFLTIAGVLQGTLLPGQVHHEENADH
jgi:ligand-binding sensor protein